MKDICNRWIKRIVRLACIPGLTFFVCLSCTQNAPSEEIAVVWKDGQAVAVIIPSAFIDDIPADSVSRVVEIGLEGNAVTMLGDLSDHDGKLTFTPIVPFTHGMHYEVRVRRNRVGSFEVREQHGNAPNVIAIYPSADTLPENLLKIYLHFDQPMREGVSGKYVKLVKDGHDTIAGAFLDLQPELWNPERTILTLWLDPGRIKRDLQPNRRLGAPMQRGTHYRILVTQGWPDVRGKALVAPYEKTFVTTAKDSLSPQPSQWTLSLPQYSSRQSLKIDFKESLDHSLLKEVFVIQDSTGNKIPGRWEIGRFEKQCSFIPDAFWKSGTYNILVEPRLEDLAGNNLVRPFDRDITKRSKAVTGEIALLPFHIK